MLSFVIRNRLALINLGLWVLVGVLTYYGLKYLLPFVVPLIFGTLIAVLFEPVVKLFVRIKFPRWLASVTALFLFFGGGATVLLLLTAKLVIELKDFAVKIPQLSAGLMARGEDLLHQGVALYGQLSPSMSDQVRTQMDKAGKTLGEIGAGMADSTVKAITNVPSMVTIFLLALIISFFLLKDFPIWQQRLLRLLHPTVREKGDVVLDDLGKATFGYLRAQAILIGITFVQVLVGLLVLHVPYAFSLSVLAAFLDILPLLGTGSLFVPWGIYMLATGNTKLGLGLLIVYGLVVLVRQVLEPKILAESIGLDPLVTIVVMYAGYQAIGFLGVLLAPFIIIAVTSLIKVRAFDFLIDPDAGDGEDDPPPVVE